MPLLHPDILCCILVLVGVGIVNVSRFKLPWTQGFGGYRIEVIYPSEIWCPTMIRVYSYRRTRQAAYVAEAEPLIINIAIKHLTSSCRMPLRRTDGQLLRVGSLRFILPL